MLLYITFCLAVTLAAGIEDPKRPVFSPVFSMRVESFGDGGFYKEKHIWVDTNHNRTRTDYLQGQVQEIYEFDRAVMSWPKVHQVFPVTTEEHLNVRKCFILSYTSILFAGTLYTLPESMTDYLYVGMERIHGEDASKWKTVINWWYENDVGTTEVNIWVTERQGVSVPLKMHFIYRDETTKIREESHINFYDYDTSDIDPEVWNIGKGMNCKATESDVKMDSVLIEEMTDLKKASKGFNLPKDFADYIKYSHNVEGLMHKHRRNQFIDRSKEVDTMRDHGQTTDSSQSKALPFPYTAEEVERLSKELPKQFDWRLYGAVTSVKSKRSSDAFYAFTAAEVVEAALFLHRGKKMAVDLSAQAITDCSWGFGNRGSDGGSAEASFEWMKKHGLPSAAAYPFTGINDYCRIDSVEIETIIKDYYRVPANDANALKVAIVNHGPVAVTFDAWNLPFQHNGVYNDSIKCRNDPGSGNFPGLVVGYGDLDGEEYWNIKTAYGADYYLDGYLLISTKNNKCGVLNSPTYVTLE